MILSMLRWDTMIGDVALFSIWRLVRSGVSRSARSGLPRRPDPAGGKASFCWLWWCAVSMSSGSPLFDEAASMSPDGGMGVAHWGLWYIATGRYWSLRGAFRRSRGLGIWRRGRHMQSITGMTCTFLRKERTWFLNVQVTYQEQREVNVSRGSLWNYWHPSSRTNAVVNETQIYIPGQLSWMERSTCRNKILIHVGIVWVFGPR